MTDKKVLKWGETPLDCLSHDELLLASKRMMAALLALNTAVRLCRTNSLWPEFSDQLWADHDFVPPDGFWGKGGTGGRAIEMGKQAVDRVASDYEGEDIYRSYFRYALDLLFDDNGYRIGFGWSVCPICGTMIGTSPNGESAEGKPCEFTKGCTGVYRKLEWSDLVIE